MSAPGGIDCDIHPSVPGIDALLPYMPEHWREIVQMRGVDELNPISYPARSPLTARPDWRPREGKPASSLEQIRARVPRSVRQRNRHLQSALRRADPVQRGHGGRVLPAR